ncbi:hypothetical protein [Streptomyces jumonjinensis]|uniref:Uncharacterized protein n=1 Tax=Streptomyces jumonjinensis TaxID=1945 RepID=A0A646KA05_STRJU|nr:hypothetical protein [Streptomyces jumonjinensis]MQS99031.1 hypothetical protein [Streptomyces jumonjinensis]
MSGSTTGMRAVTVSCDQWIQRASASELLIYVRTGSYGTSRLVDIRPEPVRRAEVLRVRG